MEALHTIDGIQFARMIHTGTVNLRNHVQTINNLNVFPIPDGDTGDNMLLTMIGGADSVRDGYDSIAETSRRMAEGTLLAARGNSGVILSQFFDGIAEGLQGVEAADNRQLGNAFRLGVQHAYNAVMEPTEGTILTVVRCATEYACSRIVNTPLEMMNDFVSEARRTLDKTPDMLPVLKKAGVVDSGGAGFIYIIEGMIKALSGEASEQELSLQPYSMQTQEIDLNLFTENSILEYGYCTELLLRLQSCKTDPDKFNVNTITDYLQTIGDSVVAFKTGSIVKIHTHTMTPDKALSFCQQYGEFLKLKIENMSLQHNNATLDAINISVKPESTRKPYGVVSVCSGEGIKRLFLERGADIIVDGGQSMNPSTEDFLEAFKQANADTILVLPNNNNIILTAQQAAKLYEDADVYVIESQTIGDGYAALSMLDVDSGDTSQIVEDLTDAMQGVVTAAVSCSVRNSSSQDIEIHIGDHIGFVGKEIIAANSERFSAVCKTIDKLHLSDFDICILIRGADSYQSEADNIEEYIHSKYPGKEVYIVDGMQEIYEYILILQ